MLAVGLLLSELSRIFRGFICCHNTDTNAYLHRCFFVLCRQSRCLILQVRCHCMKVPPQTQRHMKMAWDCTKVLFFLLYRFAQKKTRSHGQHVSLYARIFNASVSRGIYLDVFHKIWVSAVLPLIFTEIQASYLRELKIQLVTCVQKHVLIKLLSLPRPPCNRDVYK